MKNFLSLFVLLLLITCTNLVIAAPTQLSPRWYKTFDGYLDDIHVWYDGTVHVLTEKWPEEFSCSSYYTQISPYGSVKTQFKYNNISFYALSLAKGRIGVYATNISNGKDYVSVYSWSGRLLWQTEEFGNENVINVALTRYGNLYILFFKGDDKYLAKYNSRFQKVFEIKLEPVVEPDYESFWINQIFVGQDDNVYVVIGYWKYYGFWSTTLEIQKISSSGQLIWVKSLNAGEENVAWGSLQIGVQNIREFSDKVFVSLKYVNQTYFNYWVMTIHSSVLALNKNSGAILWQYDFPKISGSGPYCLFSMDASFNKIFVRYGLSQTGYSIDDKLYILDFSGKVILSYDLNLPVSPYSVRMLCASDYGHVYLFGSQEEEMCVMYMGRF